MTEYVNLADTRTLTGDDLDTLVIDEFVSSDFVLSHIPFHAAATTTGLGSAYVYNYPRLISTPTTGFRAMNENYVPSKSEVQRFTVECKPLGGAFAIDRVLARNPAAMKLEFANLTRSARSSFTNAVINGSVTDNAEAFDGLSVALTGSDTEIDAAQVGGEAWDWSDPITNANAIVGNLEELVDSVDSDQNVFLLVNKKAKSKITTAARSLNYIQEGLDGFGRRVSSFNGVPIIDLGALDGGNDPIIPVDETLEDADTDLYTGTDVYVVRFGYDGFHAVSPAGEPIVRTYLPDLEVGGQVNKFGEVEMVATVALKATKAAAVARNIKIGVPA